MSATADKRLRNMRALEQVVLDLEAERDDLQQRLDEQIEHNKRQRKTIQNLQTRIGNLRRRLNEALDALGEAHDLGRHPDWAESPYTAQDMFNDLRLIVERTRPILAREGRL